MFALVKLYVMQHWRFSTVDHCCLSHSGYMLKINHVDKKTFTGALK